MKRLLTIFVVLLTAVTGCGEVHESHDDQISWLVDHSGDYLDDASWRRAELEASMWRPELPYARERLANYGLTDQGWDLLPELQPLVAPIFPGQEPVELKPIPTQIPTSRQEWIDLGEEVFWQMPMRRDGYLQWLADRPELHEEVGISQNEDGSLRGIVRFRDARGQPSVGATCGLCHGADGLAGRASTDLDLGLGRAVFNEAHNRPGDVYAAWEPGRIDVTDDGVSDPLKIPNLWGVDSQSYLNASGAVRVASPASLAVRFESQYIVGHNLEVRPNRVLVWALTIYVLSLEYGDHDPDFDSPGAAVFQANCAACHNPDAGFSGGLIDADLMIGDALATRSAERGTGLLKIPSLIGIGAGAPYLHDARYDTLLELLEAGHPQGGRIDGEDLDHLLDFLQTL